MQALLIGAAMRSGAEYADKALEQLLPLRDEAYGLAVRILSSRESAEDVVQEAYLGAFRSLRRGPPPENPRAWFLKVLTNAARMHLRSEVARNRREMEAEAMRTEPLAGDDLTGPLRTAMEMLEVKYRVPVSLCCEYGHTQREAATVLEMPERTVSKYVSVGLAKLRRALERAGYPAAVAVLLGGLKQTAPAVPASLAGRVEALVSSGAKAEPRKFASRAARKRSAARGGFAMKLVAGLVLAGAVAAGVAVSVPGRVAPASPSLPKGPPGHEHVASVNGYGDDLDGPAKEAVGFRGGSPDAKGNLWGGRWLRASDGRVLRMQAYEYGTLGFNLEEGPIVGRPVQFVGTTYGWNCGGSAILGAPDAGGETGGIYESLGRKGQLVRLWRNKDKDDRWWFARVAGGGDAPPPKKRGGSADALKVKFAWIHQPQVGLDGKIRFLAENAFYMMEDGKVTCVLAPDDYKEATAAMKGLPNGGYAGGDGSFYLGYYYSSSEAYNGQAAAVWRVAPDGKVEPYAQSHGHTAGDGDALTQAGWFCGPHLHRHRSARFIPANAMLTSAHDEDFIRRIQDRRVATLCTDGEWREFGPGKKRGALDACGMVIGPGGTVYHTYRSWVDVRLWRYTGLDLAKPAAQKR